MQTLKKTQKNFANLKKILSGKIKFHLDQV